MNKEEITLEAMEVIYERHGVTPESINKKEYKKLVQEVIEEMGD